MADETAVYQYDAEGNLTRAYDADSDVYFYYDALGRDTLTVQNGQPVKYTYYTGMWDRKTVRDPGGGVHTYSYDLLSRLTQIVDPVGGVTTFEYDLANRRARRVQANGVETAYTYDASGQVTRIAATYGAAVMMSFDYTYDAQGNRSGWTYEDGRAFKFKHDYQGQLIEATLRDAGNNVLYDDDFGYDGANNRTLGGPYSGYVYDAANRLVSTTTSSYSYDLDGNLVRDSSAAGVYTYGYDREGRQISQSGPGLAVTFRYDALGRRIEQNVNGAVTRFVYDGQDVLVDMDTAGTVLVRYTHGPWVDELVSARLSGATYYYLQDALGSVVRILDSARHVKNRYEYLAWGEIWSQTEGIANRYTYTGREGNPDGRTMHYRARTYLPHLGRFAQEDPLGFVDGVNLYRYAMNRPCTLVDPYGLDSNCLKEAIDAGIAAAGFLAEMILLANPTVTRVIVTSYMAAGAFVAVVVATVYSAGSATAEYLACKQREKERKKKEEREKRKDKDSGGAGGGGG